MRLAEHPHAAGGGHGKPEKTSSAGLAPAAADAACWAHMKSLKDLDSKGDIMRTSGMASALIAALFVVGDATWATPEFFPGTGHYYDVISAHGVISWSDAEVAAEAQIWQGQHGYLAAIASAAENDFVFDLSLDSDIWHFSGSWYQGPWLGGFQEDGSEEPAGGWAWVTGEPWSYTNWMEGQSDNNGPPGEDENRLCLWSQGMIAPTWNDFIDVLDPMYPPEYGIWGYVVEFDVPPVPVKGSSWGRLKADFR